MSALRIWVRGLAAAFIGGGAGAVTATVSVVVIEPQTSIHHLLILGATTFVMNGLLGIMFYLKQSPLPGDNIALVNPGGVVASSGSPGAVPPSQPK